MIRSSRRNVTTVAASQFIVLAALPAGAQTFGGFGGSFQYENQGFNPSVAIYDGVIVEVHNGAQGAGPLVSKVGRLAQPIAILRSASSAPTQVASPAPAKEASAAPAKEASGALRIDPPPLTLPPISWGDDQQFDDDGFNPSVALTGSTAIEVNNGKATPGPLYYRTGTVVGGVVNWGEKKQYDTGFNPQVAVSGNTVVEVHNEGATTGPLWYRMGKLNGLDISWSDSHKFDSFSTNPAIGIAGGCGSLTNACVIEVHNDNAAPGPLWTRNGDSTDGATITWGNPVEYGGGWNPKIAYLGGAVLLEVHNGQAGSGPLYYYSGALSGQPVQYDNGNNPSVAIDPVIQGEFPFPPPGHGKTIWQDVVEVHNGAAGLGPLWYHFSQITEIEILQ